MARNFAELEAKMTPAALAESDRHIQQFKSLEEIAAEQGLKPFDVEAARQQAAGIWPDDESADDFTAWLREERCAVAGLTIISVRRIESQLSISR